MGGCYVISSMTTAMVYKRTSNKRKSMLIGFGTGLAFGVAKELYDIKHNLLTNSELIVFNNSRNSDSIPLHVVLLLAYSNTRYIV